MMPASGKVLEDSIRLSRIRRIKLTLYGVQAAMIVALGVLVVFVIGEAHVKPTLYLPLNSFMAVLVLLLLILCLESFFFRLLEIRFARSSSARHLMAKNSIKRSLMIIIVTGVVAMILAVPGIRGSIENSGQAALDVSPNYSPAFYSSDVFALLNVKEVKIEAQKEVHIYLVTEEVYQRYVGNISALYALRLNTANFVVNTTSVNGFTLTLDVPLIGYMKYRVVLNNMLNPGTSATMTLVKEFSTTFTGLVSLLLIAFVASNAAWIAYLTPIERKYSVSSIYK